MAKQPRTMRTRSEVIKQRRRERQLLVFGLLVIALGVLGFGAYSVYSGRAVSPVDYAIVTRPAEYENNVTVPCPPADQGGGENFPMMPDQVGVRVLNGTDTQGLASTTLEILVGRGYVGVGATNWYRTYEDVVRIQFGVDGLRQAYTVAANFPEYEMVLDTRKGSLVDIIVGAKFKTADVRPGYAPELAADVELTAVGECQLVKYTDQEPAPHIIPVNPLDPVASATPSPSASTEPSA